MSRFAADFAAASDLLSEAFGEEISLVRGGNTTTGVTAEVTTHKYQGEGEEGFITTFVFTDFVIAIADYAFASTVATPRKGDRILRVIDSVTHTYEVLPIPGGRECEWSDDSGNQWLCHAKHIDP